MKIQYTDGWKYQLDKTVRFKLKNDFKITKEYKNQYYRISKTGYVTIYRGCCWDGPTWFPDVKWMMVPSLIHDVLHWLIARGVIEESDNDLIDAELGHWIVKEAEKVNATSLRLNIYKFRAWYVRKATNLVDQKKGQLKKVYTT